MNGNVIRVPVRSLKEQFSRSSEAWREQSDPIFRFWAAGDWWGFPFFSLSASRPLGTDWSHGSSRAALCGRGGSETRRTLRADGWQPDWSRESDLGRCVV